MMRPLFLTLLLVGCTEHATELIQMTPLEQWRMHNIHHYTIEQVRSCYCINGGVKVKITVRADTVFSVVTMADTTEVSPAVSKYYRTIDSLFGTIMYSQAESLAVMYDADYGFPSRLDIDPHLHPVDGGVLYETGNLRKSF